MKKLVELDSLRGLMALWVFMTHVLYLSGSGGGRLALLADGAPPVRVFIILSGFAIASSLIHSRATLWQYLVRRAVRIYPIYLVALLVGLMTFDAYGALLQHVGWIAPESIARNAKIAAASQSHFWPSLIAHLTMMHGAIPNRYLYGAAVSFNGPLWSLSLEWQFYLVAPVVVAAFVSPARHWLLLAALVLVAAIAVQTVGWRFDLMPSFLPLMLGFFFLGIVCAIYLPQIAAHPDSALTVGALMIGVAGLSGNIEITLSIAIWCVVLACCLHTQNRALGLLRRFLAMPFMVKAGERSYGFYALHIPIITLWGTWLASHGFAVSKWIFAVGLLTSAPVTLGLAWISYDYLEQPLNDWAKRRFRGARTVPAEFIEPEPS